MKNPLTQAVEKYQHVVDTIQDSDWWYGLLAVICFLTGAGIIFTVVQIIKDLQR